MTIGDLKSWLATLPANFDDMSLVLRQYDTLTKEDKKDGDGTYYAYDVPISSGFVDEENRECCLLDEKSRNFIIKMNENLNN